jgi:Tol biopolymer transport system component
LDGVLVYGAAEGRVMGVRFDAGAHKVVGEPVTLLESVSTRAVVRAALSRNGTLAYLSTSGNRVLRIVDAHGTPSGTLPVEAREWSNVNVSPDGRQLALQTVNYGGRGELWVYDMTSHVTRKLQDNVLENVRWTPDGRRIAFLRKDPTGFFGYWLPVDGSAPAERIPNTVGVQSISQFIFSPDGKYIVGFSLRGSSMPGRGVVAIPLDAKRPPFPLFQADRLLGAPLVSPDGKWLAYTTAERGAPEVYVRSFAPGGGTAQISNGGGRSAAWSADDRHLIYDRNGSFWNVTLDVNGPLPRVVRSDSMSASMTMARGRSSSSSRTGGAR